MSTVRFVAIAVVLMSTATLVTAHHSAAVHYQVEKTITLSGVVTEFRFVNPHSVVRIAVSDGKGGEVVWSAEWAPTTLLRRMGMTADALKKGDRVTILGSPARDGSNDLLMQRLTFADGRQFGLGGATPPEAPAGQRTQTAPTE